MRTAPIGTPSPYLLHCYEDKDFGSCGQSTYLTEEQYNSQIMNLNSTWKCPKCGCKPCDFDDANYEKRTFSEEPS